MIDHFLVHEQASVISLVFSMCKSYGRDSYIVWFDLPIWKDIAVKVGESSEFVLSYLVTLIHFFCFFSFDLILIFQYASAFRNKLSFPLAIAFFKNILYKSLPFQKISSLLMFCIIWAI